jgi:cyanate lyase
VQVFYPFHPLYGSTLKILRRPKRGDGSVSVIDGSGKRLKFIKLKDFGWSGLMEANDLYRIGHAYL